MNFFLISRFPQFLLADPQYSIAIVQISFIFSFQMLPSKIYIITNATAAINIDNNIYDPTSKKYLNLKYASINPPIFL